MNDPTKTFRLHIGQQTREFRFTMLALRIIQKRFDNHTVLELLQKIDVNTICEFAAAGLAGAGDRKSSSERVCDWLEAEPEKFAPLTTMCTRGILAAYQRIMPKEEQEALGKELAAVDQAAAEMEMKSTSTIATVEVATSTSSTSPPA